jgi:O-antigen ligase
MILNPTAQLWPWQMKMQTLAQRFFIFFAFCLPISLALENVSFILTLIAALLSGLWWTYRKQTFSNTMTIFLGLLLFLFIVGLFYSKSTMLWRLWAFKKESEIISIVFLLAIIPYDRNFVLTVCKGMVYGAIAVVVIAWLGQFNWLPHKPWFEHPAPYYVFFKIYAALLMAFAAYLALVLCKFEWHTNRKWLWAMSFVIISYNVLWQSLSRTGYIIFFVLLVLFALQFRDLKKKLLGLVAALVIGILGLLASGNLTQGLAQIYHNEQHVRQGDLASSTGVRVGYLQNTLTLFKEHPILGHGTGGYSYAAIQIHGITAMAGVSSAKAPQVTPENTFYRILVEHGAVGMIIFLLFWLWQLVTAFRLSDSVYRNIAVGFMLTMIIASMSQDLILDESPRLFYILFSSLLYAPWVFGKLRKAHQ